MCVCLLFQYQVKCYMMWCVWCPNIKCPAGRRTISKGGWYTAPGSLAPGTPVSGALFGKQPLMHPGTLCYTAPGAPWYNLVQSALGWYTASGGESSPAHLQALKSKGNKSYFSAVIFNMQFRVTELSLVQTRLYS